MISCAFDDFATEVERGNESLEDLDIDLGLRGLLLSLVVGRRTCGLRKKHCEESAKVEEETGHGLKDRFKVTCGKRAR